ncbi:MAG: hypothetical protein WDO14_20895 [Bacteroidota bacterium]
MKALLPVILLTFLLSCHDSKDDPQKVYTDIGGTWKFDDQYISGSFEIAKFEDSFVIYEENGTFTLNKNGYKVTYRSILQPIKNSPGTYDNITLIDDTDPDQEITIRFSEPTIEEFTEFKCSGYTTRIGLGALDQSHAATAITISRK